MSIIIKKSGGLVRIPGVFPSVQFGEQVLSTGIPSLDGFIGGGVSLGSILLIRDNFPSRYGDLLLKTFLAEGASYNHHLFVSSGKEFSFDFANQLPSLKNTKNEGSVNVENDMKIAWRYKNPTSFGIIKGQKEAKFEFTKKMSVEDLGGKNIETFDIPLTLLPNENNDMKKLLKEIGRKLYSFRKNEKSSVANLVRIGISHQESVLSPQFFYGLRALIRNSNSAAVVTVSESFDLRGSQHLCDGILELEAIIEENRKIELGDVDGICRIIKFSSINSLKPYVLPKDLGFSFRKKRLTFQELNIAPDSETNKGKETPIIASSCGTTIKGKSIDF